MHPVIIPLKVYGQNWLWVVEGASERAQRVYVPLWMLMLRSKPLKKRDGLVLHMPVRVMMKI